jgi:WhiB family transcriptional regulator, redox-sensing transcriptional regulator
MPETSWTFQAQCRGRTDDMFPEPREQKRARRICFGCPVQAECLAEALDNQIEWGVWGGKTERERRLILRFRPDVTSWRALLCDESRAPAPRPRQALAS